MKKFLEKIVDEIITNNYEINDRLWIIIPNRRGMVFIKKHLSERINSPVFSPTILPIDDLIRKLSKQHILTNEVLLFELYNIYKNRNLPFSSTFEEFIAVGSNIIHDFNEIDLHLANPKEVYLELNRIKALELWSPDKPELTDLQVRYLEFYNALYSVYLEFNETLDSTKSAYQGKAYRHVAENMDNFIDENRYDHILFCGFNALSKSEEKIVKAFKRTKNCSIYWDADKYYVENNYHEAGKFLREQSFDVPSKLNWIEDNFKTSDKKVNIIGVSQKVGQAKAVGSLLSKLNNADIENTAIVLADETLLQPLLNSIPEHISKINITMGLPLKVTPAYSFFESWLKMHINSYKLTNNETSSVYYHKDVLALLSHPYLNDLLQTDTSKIIRHIVTKNKVFISINDINWMLTCDEDKSIIEKLFPRWNNNPNLAIDSIILFISFYKGKIKLSIDTKDKKSDFNQKLNLEYLFSFYKVFNQLKMLCDKYQSIENVRTLYKLFQQISFGQSVAFFGEPLEGLQIMGLLETRTLDFDHLIMLSVNENVLPSGKSYNSIIPFEVKRANEIPTFIEKDSIFAYHFYRLLQRANKIDLIYDCDSKSETNEKSRFLIQLETELPKYNKNSIVTNTFFSYKPDLSAKNEIKIIKTPEIIDSLKQLYLKGISPSAINTYISCPLKYYLRYIVKLEEKDEISENVDDSTLGNIFHQTLQTIYLKFENNEISANAISLHLKDVEHILKDSFKNNFENGNAEQGKNLLTLKVAENLIKTFLKKEISEINHGNKITILHLEKQFEYMLSLPESNTPVLLKGIIDRIDKFNNTIRIIDYKTGNVDPKILKIKDFEILFTNGKYEKAVQLLFYQYLFSKSNSQKEILTGIVSFKKLSEYIIQLKDETENSVGLMNLFEEGICNLLELIINPDYAFCQTDDFKNCIYCSFKNICVK